MVGGDKAETHELLGETLQHSSPFAILFQKLQVPSCSAEWERSGYSEWLSAAFALIIKCVFEGCEQSRVAH